MNMVFLSKNKSVVFVFTPLTILLYRVDDLSLFEESSSVLIAYGIIIMFLTGMIPSYLQNSRKRNLFLPLLGIIMGVITDSVFDAVFRGIDRNLVGLEIIMLLFVLGPLIAIIFFFANGAYSFQKRKNDDL